jgi:hypothetical protein
MSNVIGDVGDVGDVGQVCHNFFYFFPGLVFLFTGDSVP